MALSSYYAPEAVKFTKSFKAEGEIFTAIDSKARRIADYMSITVTTRDRTLILGGSDDEPELYGPRGRPRRADQRVERAR